MLLTVTLPALLSDYTSGHMLQVCVRDFTFTSNDNDSRLITESQFQQNSPWPCVSQHTWICLDAWHEEVVWSELTCLSMSVCLCRTICHILLMNSSLHPVFVQQPASLSIYFESQDCGSVYNAVKHPFYSFQLWYDLFNEHIMFGKFAELVPCVCT